MSRITRRTFAQTLATLPLLRTAGAITPGKPPTPSAPHVTLNPRDFGATGDGVTKETLALQQALDRASVLGGGTVNVPAGTYLTGALAFRSNTTLHLEEGATLHGSPDLADYPVTQVRWEGKWIKGYIGLLSAQDAVDIAITGKGSIVGNKSIPGRVDKASGMRNPALLEFVNCTHVRITDCLTDQNDMWSIHPVYCTDIAFHNVTVNSGADGIDVDSCKNVVIDNCTFTTADDCISLKSGRGMEGNTIARPTEDVTISNCTFHDLHWACIGIGSETSAGIRNVRVTNCKCLSARTFAIYIKSRPGRGAFIENITMDGLEVSGAQQGFLRINMLNSGKQDEDPVPGDAGIPTIRNLRFSNIHVTDMPQLVDAVSIHPAKPIDGLTLSNIAGTCAKGISIANARHVLLRDIHVTGYTGPLLSLANVTGTGLTPHADLTPTPIPTPVPEPATPYKLH